MDNPPNLLSGKERRGYYDIYLRNVPSLYGEVNRKNTTHGGW